MKKVYCMECKFLETMCCSFRFLCSHPSVRKKVTTRDWLSETTIELKGDPKEINANNDCKLFRSWRDQ